jgi:predicted RNase H-like HicB family nuclease
MAKTYQIVLETNGQGWSAYAPDLPGCVAAARTREAALDLMREAIAFHVEGLQNEDQPKKREN